MYLLLFFIGILAVHAKSSRSHASTSTNALTTITPAGTHDAVTITAQYQAVPSYVPDASSYAQYLWVSTTITDADGKPCTVTRTEEPITIRHTKNTFTHTTRSTQYGYASPTGTHMNSTTPPSYTVSEWEELYELISEAKFKDLGPMALKNYTGSGLCVKKCHGKQDIIYQPAHVKEYKHGKWSSYNTTYTYGIPTLLTSTYASPGIYTVPAYDMTVYTTTTVLSEATFTAPAGSTVTYGGMTTSVDQPCTLTAHYGAYITQDGKTKTVIKTTTIYATKPGSYIVAKPTVTRYDRSTRCTYPTTHVYRPGVYQHTRETITVTKPHQTHVCSYSYDQSHQSSPFSTPSMYTHASRPTSHTTLPSSKPSTSPSHICTTHLPTTTATTSTRTLPSSTATSDDTPSSSTGPSAPDPSSDYEEPEESYGTAYAEYAKRGGVLERRTGKGRARGVSHKRVILV